MSIGTQADNTGEEGEPQWGGENWGTQTLPKGAGPVRLPWLLAYVNTAALWFWV